MRFSILLSLFLVSCGGSQFQGQETIETDAGSDSNPSVDVAILQDSPNDNHHLSPEASTDGFESDAANDVADSDTRNDAWPDDVILEPYCPTSEVWPAYSHTCYVWGMNHGWTLAGCCLPDHRCGTVIAGMCRP